MNIRWGVIDCASRRGRSASFSRWYYPVCSGVLVLLILFCLLVAVLFIMDSHPVVLFEQQLQRHWNKTAELQARSRLPRLIMATNHYYVVS